MNQPSNTLVNILIGKALIELLLVAGIAVGFYVTSFPPTFHGWGEAVTQTRSISGWAVNDANPWERVEVQLFIDGGFVSSQKATQPRLDVMQAGWSKDEWHGYKFELANLSAGRREARVYAVHGSGGGERFTLQLLGDPIIFEVLSDGSWVSEAKR